MKSLVILNNIGTPQSTSAKDVGKYLSEFLNDPWVIQAPAWIRKIFVDGLIVPRRKYASAEKYKKIWTPTGSPLLTIMMSLKEKIQQQLGDDYVVEVGMRYGSPSIGEVLRKFREKNGQPKKIYFLPLYPQYAEASFRSSVEKLEDESLKVFGQKDSPWILQAFFDRPEWTQVFANLIRENPEFRPDFDPKTERMLFSFHGLPELHVKKTPGCLMETDCCEKPGARLPTCYRAQSYATAHAIAKELGLKREQYAIAFQSRLGPTQWIRPHSDVLLKEWRDQGIKKVIVACPSFSVDCLETLEEVGIQFKELFEQGDPTRKLVRVDCPNDRQDWVKSLSFWISEAGIENQA